MAETETTDIQLLREENELLLLQLHQVQEELEHYYLEYQKARTGAAGPGDSPVNGTPAPFPAPAALPMALIAKLRKSEGLQQNPPDVVSIVRNSPEYAQLAFQLDQATVNLADLQGRIEAARREHSEAQAEWESRRATLAGQLEAKRREHAEAEAEWESQRATLAGQLEAKRREHSEAEAEWARARVALQVESAEIAERAAALQAELAALEAEKSAWESQRAGLTAQLEASRREHSEDRAKWEQVRARLTNEAAEKAKSVAGLQAQIAKLEAARADLESERESLADRLAVRQREHSQAQSEWERARARLTREAAVKAERLAELQGQIANLEAAKGDLETQHKNLAGQLEACDREHAEAHAEWRRARVALQAELARHSESLETALTRAAELETQKADVEAERQALQQQVEKRKEECTGLRAQIEAKMGEIDAARADVAMALRVQTMRENDLRELQERYAAVLEIKNRQEELLMRLQDRLGVAAECLKQLRAEGGDSLNLEAARALIESLAEPAAETGK